jgi:flagellar hook protein FlgE
MPTGAVKVDSIVKLTPSDDLGSKNFDIVFDFTKLSTFVSSSTAETTFVDGYPSGELVSYSIGADGGIIGVYSNGRQQPLALIGLANFDNPAGLQRIGENMYIPSPNSGNFVNAVRAGMSNAGTISPGTLEMSNVDLAQQFTDMIVTQRGFQANSRIMTTVDEMLQELVNLKR